MLYTDSAAPIGYATAPKELRRRVHQPIPQKCLRQVITVCSHALAAFRFRVANLRRPTRRRHGQKDHGLDHEDNRRGPICPLILFVLQFGSTWRLPFVIWQTPQRPEPEPVAPCEAVLAAFNAKRE